MRLKTEDTIPNRAQNHRQTQSSILRQISWPKSIPLFFEESEGVCSTKDKPLYVYFSIWKAQIKIPNSLAIS